jgi:tyrosyl-tRNA synthetase
MNTNIFPELTWRGLINQTTDDGNLPRLLKEKSRTVYVGFDPTADSLHVGHLVALMVLHRFQKAGHRPIALVGGATGMIGDPSGKSEERNLLSPETLQANVAGMKTQLQRFLDFDCGHNSAVLVNNYDWMGHFGYLEFLRDVGKHFPVNIMLSKDSVRSRLDRTAAGLSYTEFSYMLLQAYDFVYLNEHYGCELQAGGSDQWGNITAGIDLARRLRGVQLYGCTCPLLTRSDGSKMGKTESGALWLSPYKTEPRDFYNYWINVEDDDIDRCLRFFTDMDQAELEALMAEHRRDPGQRLAQRKLAAELTDLVHGVEDREKIEQGSRVIYAQGDERLEMISKASGDVVPTFQLAREKLSGDGMPIIDAFVESGLCKTKNEARRIIVQGGGYVNDVRIENIEMRLTTDHVFNESMILLRSGKKNYMRLQFT